MLRIVITMAMACWLLACKDEDRARSVASAAGRELPAAWNERLMAVAVAEDNLLTLKGVRTAAMMHLAMHDALNAAVPVYAPYRHAGPGRGADPIAAAARAAYRISVTAYPGAATGFEDELAHWLARVDDGTAKSRGVELGESAAAELLRAREGDGWNAEVPYELRPPGPGVYAEFPEHSGTPAGFVFGVGFGRATPFMLERAGQFRVPPPPALESEAYAQAFTEVAELGRADSDRRSADQTHLAFFWKEFVESSLGRLARELSAKSSLDLWESARLFALLNAAIFDGYVSSFESKFFYDHWRPYTAIRAADTDGNDRTTADATWDNTHHHTYPFPSYPSAHGTVCAAAFAAFADALGDDTTFTMTTPEVSAGGPMSPPISMVPPARSFSSFSEAALECALSRVYLGIHFRYDSEAGNALGRQVGAAAIAKLAPAQ